MDPFCQYYYTGGEQEKMEQVPITREQVQGLITGTVAGYEGILSLNGDHYTHSFEGGPFKGVSKVTINNAGELGEIVENMIGLTLGLSLPSVDISTSRIYGADFDITELNTLSDAQANKEDAVLAGMKFSAEEQRDGNQQRVELFRKAMTALRETYRTGDVKQVADALEKTMDVAYWGTKVETLPLYQAGKAILSLADFNATSGFRGARDISHGLRSALNQAKVREILLGTERRTLVKTPWRVVPEQTFEGPLDQEIMAKELLGNHS